jgi:hypothetical protein
MIFMFDLTLEFFKSFPFFCFVYFFRSFFSIGLTWFYIGNWYVNPANKFLIYLVLHYSEITSFELKPSFYLQGKLLDIPSIVFQRKESSRVSLFLSSCKIGLIPKSFVFQEYKKILQFIDNFF